MTNMHYQYGYIIWPWVYTITPKKKYLQYWERCMDSALTRGRLDLALLFLYPATKVWRGIMLYPSVSVRPSVRPSAPFPIDNLSIYSRNFFKFCIHIVIGDEWYGIVNGQNPSIFNGVTALFRIGKMVSGLLFLYCS